MGGHTVFKALYTDVEKAERLDRGCYRIFYQDVPAGGWIREKRSYIDHCDWISSREETYVRILGRGIPLHDVHNAWLIRAGVMIFFMTRTGETTLLARASKPLTDPFLLSSPATRISSSVKRFSANFRRGEHYGWIDFCEGIINWSAIFDDGKFRLVEEEGGGEGWDTRSLFHSRNHGASIDCSEPWSDLITAPWISKQTELKFRSELPLDTAL